VLLEQRRHALGPPPMLWSTRLTRVRRSGSCRGRTRSPGASACDRSAPGGTSPPAELEDTTADTADLGSWR
jgi:hypothetical protein